MSGASETDCSVPATIANIVTTMLPTAATTALTEVIRDYSPVTLCQEWPRVTRLLFLLFCCIYGSFLNGFFVSSFFVDCSLRHVGNVFLAFSGLADMLITAGIAPVAAFVILSGQWDNLYVCKSLHFLGLTATYCYMIYFMFVSLESYYRFCLVRLRYGYFIPIRVGVLCLVIAGVCTTFGVAGAYYKLDVDYCERQHHGSFSYRIASTVVMHLLPILVTLYYLYTTFGLIKRRASICVQYRRSKTFEREYSMALMNIMAYWVHLIFWSPYAVMVYAFPESSNGVFYNLMVMGLFRSVITSTLYGLFHPNFRQTYAHLFNYCCCKNSLSDRAMCRHRRYVDTINGPTEIRVHIIQRGISTSPRRSRPSTADTFAL